MASEKIEICYHSDETLLQRGYLLLLTSGRWLHTCCCVWLPPLALSSAYVVLEDSEYIRLNDVNGEKTINASTSNRLAFDEEHSLLYVLGMFKA